MPLNEILKVTPLDCATCELAVMTPDREVQMCGKVALAADFDESARGSRDAWPVDGREIARMETTCRLTRESHFRESLPKLPIMAYIC